MNGDPSSLIDSGRLPAWHVLRGKTAFQQLFQHGQVIPARLVSMRYLIIPDRPLDKRVGFIAGRKLGNAAQRNKVKRYMREAYRTNKDQLAELLKQKQFGLHFVFIARNASASYQGYLKDCTYLMRKLQQTLLN